MMRPYKFKCEYTDEMPEPLVRIDSMELDELSLVGSGDDPMAHVVISKAAPDDKNTAGGDSPATMTTTLTSEDDMPNGEENTQEIDLDALPEDVRQYITEMEDVVEQALAALGDDGDEDEDEGSDSEKELVGVGKAAPAPSVDEILKSNPELAAIVKSANERAENAEAIAKAERDRRVEHEMIEKAAALPMIGAKDELAAVLRKLYETVPEEAATVEKMLRTANAQLKESALYSEVGKSSPGLSDPIASGVAEIRKAHPDLTAEQATDRYFSENPSAYAAYLREGA